MRLEQKSIFHMKVFWLIECGSQIDNCILWLTIMNSFTGPVYIYLMESISTC